MGVDFSLAGYLTTSLRTALTQGMEGADGDAIDSKRKKKPNPYLGDTVTYMESQVLSVSVRSQL